MGNRKNGSISLKEAAELTGYAPDYIGQLIRQGKLEGEQVYSNVSWVTTKEALDAYLQGRSGEAKRQWWEAYTTIEAVSAFSVGVLRVCIALSVLFIIFLLYVLAVAIDHKLAERYVESVTAESYE